MFHVAAYAETIGPTVDIDIDAAVDDILTIQNSHFVLSERMNLYWAAVMSATLLRAKLASPSMRQITTPFIRPINVAATPGNNPNVWILTANPFSIPPFEEIQMQATSGVAMTEPFAGFIALGRHLDPLPVGNMIPWRWTSTTAAAISAWTTITPTFADALPSGVYEIVGSECQSTTGKAHRWIIPNQIPRPGNLSYTALSQRSPYALSLGQMGSWGTFRSNDLPRPQVFCGAADAAHEGYLWIVRRAGLAA